MWMKLMADEAQTLYRVGADTAADPAYEFYESSVQRRTAGYDGPWSLVALAVTADLATLRIANLEEEQLDWDGYDPLEYAPGFLLLDRPELEALAELIAATARRLGDAADGPRFTALDGDDVEALGLGDEVFDGHRQSFHLAPAPHGHEGVPGAAVIFSSIDPQPADLLFVGIRELTSPGGGDAPRAGSDAPARVTLDRTGLGELAALLSDEAEHLAGP